MGKIDTKKIIRVLTPVLPYILIGLVATNLGEAWRLAGGASSSEKIVGLMSSIPLAFGNFWPSIHPFDLLVGAICGGALRLAVFLKSKNSKNYKHNIEYGSARWGTHKDIAPFIDPEFKDNIILTRTESLMMSNRPPNPYNARNKNVLIIGGSGSGKTRFWLKPSAPSRAA